MARPLKEGLNYFSFDVDFFSDKKIKRLRASYGTDGISVYIYLLCEIYRAGYYIDYDDDLILDISDELKISKKSTMQILNYLFSRSLLDGKLARSVKVLSAESIQRRYQEAKKGAKRDVYVEGKFWVLEKKDTLSFIKVNTSLSFSRNNNSFSEKNDSNSEKNYTKESKVKESKVKESKKEKPHPLTKEEYNLLVSRHGEAKAEDYVKRTTQYKCCNLETIEKWILEDKEKKPVNKNKFNSFPQRDYSKEQMQSIEKKLLEKNLKEV